MFPMSRRVAFITVIAVAFLAILLALQPHSIERTLMQRFLPRSAQSFITNLRQARRAFIPYQPKHSTFSTSTSIMSSARTEDSGKTPATHAGDITLDPEDPTNGNDSKALPLPPPPSEEEAQKLNMSSGEATIKMDHLGPLVVNRDGTLSRIGNWEQMTELEKKNTLRILGKRNQLRTNALQEADGGAEGEAKQ